jgi:hypothetical protein
MKRIENALIGATMVAAVSIGGMGSALAVPVDAEIMLAIDVSNSVSAADFTLQRDGWAAAFQDSQVQTAIASGGGVAVSLLYFGTTADGANYGKQIDWTLLQNATDANSFASAIGALTGPDANDGSGLGLTNIASGIELGRTEILGANGYEGTRLVIDVSGDGQQNVLLDGTDGTAADELADLMAEVSASESAGITINGLSIGDAGLLNYYTDNVITSDGFAIDTGFTSDFANAARRKIFAEVTGTDPNDLPEPGALAVFGFGLAALGYLHRRRRKA